jgi:hypothetical protein
VEIRTENIERGSHLTSGSSVLSCIAACGRRRWQ